jgi:hypothetical protein
MGGLEHPYVTTTTGEVKMSQVQAPPVKPVRVDFAAEYAAYEAEVGDPSEKGPNTQGQCFTVGPPVRKRSQPPPQYRRPHFRHLWPKRCPGVSHLEQTGCSSTIR